MFGRLDNTVQHATDDKSTGGRPSDRRPSMVGGWAKAMGWGSLAVAGCVAVLLLVAPNDMRGAEPEPVMHEARMLLEDGRPGHPPQSP